MNKEKPKVLGGLGEKKSNSGTQWYQQDRIYDNKIAISITATFLPWYLEKEENMNDLRIRKLTPKECLKHWGRQPECYGSDTPHSLRSFHRSSMRNRI